MKHNTYFIREHEIYTTDNTVYGIRKCSHCGTRSGLGFYIITQCALRFNEKGFQEYLNFRNISRIAGTKTYVRRFSSETYSRRELVQDFKRVVDREKTWEIVKQPPYCTTNPT